MLIQNFSFYVCRCRNFLYVTPFNKNRSGTIFIGVGLYLFCELNNSVYFIMGPNIFTVMKKATCRKIGHIYNSGELQRVAVDYRYSKGRKGNHYHNYSVIVFPTKESADNIFSLCSRIPLFTKEEIDYFLYYINTHIQTKMKA